MRIKTEVFGTWGLEMIFMRTSFTEGLIFNVLYIVGANVLNATHTPSAKD